jgi:hypothetical protein
MREPRLEATDRLVMLAIEKLADDDGIIVMDDETVGLLGAVIENPELLGYLGNDPISIPIGGQQIVIDGDIWWRATYDDIAAVMGLGRGRDDAEYAVRELEAAGALLIRTLADGSTAYRVVKDWRPS